jgi:hypothetical protein
MIKRKPYGMLSVQECSTEIMKKLAQKSGFFDIRFLTDWKQIAGEQIAESCLPVKIVYDPFLKQGTLFIYSENPHFKSTFIYHKDIILSKVRFYFGVSNITDLKLIKY